MELKIRLIVVLKKYVHTEVFKIFMEKHIMKKLGMDFKNSCTNVTLYF